MLILGWDNKGNIVKRVTKSGARYIIWQISLTDDKKTVKFIGQSRDSIMATLAELEVGGDGPKITTQDQKTFPAAPSGWDWVNLTDPNKLEFDPAHYPVLLYKGVTYTSALVKWNA